MRTRLPALAVAFVSVATPSFAAPVFEQVGPVGFATESLFTGTISEGMGDATVAHGRGASGALLNAAKIGGGNSAELQYGQMEWFNDHVRIGAASLEWKSLRLSLVRNQLDTQVEIRSALDPDGTLTDIENHIDVVGLSYGHRMSVGLRSSLSASVGANFRRYYQSFGPNSVSELAADTFDLGGAVRVATETPLLDYAATAGVAVTNVSEAEAEFEGRAVDVPAALRYGVELEIGWRQQPTLPAVLRLRLAYAHTHTRDFRSRDRDHWGAEAITLARIAVRVGKDGNAPFGETRYGLGFHVDDPWTGPLHGSIDWTRVVVDDDSIFSDDLDLFGFTLGLDAF